jgi:GR25 family glycosyltransferase involved in LPS biosynthesis
MIEKTFIIHMTKHAKRKEYIQNALTKTNIQNYVFFDAIDGEHDLKKYNFNVIGDWYDEIKKRKMTVNEIGCALSHYKIWETIVTNKIKQTLILEDDVVFLENFNEEYKNIQNIPFDYDICFLGRTKLNELYNLGEEVEINESLVIPKYSYNMQSYILTYEGACKLINTNFINHLLPVDEFLPIMYDNDYPHINYKKHFQKFKRLRAIALKKCITNQVAKTIFPSSVDNSPIYNNISNPHPVFYYKSIPDYVIKQKYI